MNISVIIPTLNAAAQIVPLLEKLKAQTLPPDEIIVVDSASVDGTALAARQHGAAVLSIPRDQFDHGGTRDMALRQSRGEYVLFLTQDALPVDECYIQHLLEPFADERVGAASGRQIAPGEARPYERAVRAFRYPPESRVWGAEERAELGIRAFFLTDVCAAYRRSAYEAAGGFERPLMTNEDMLIAAALLDQGFRLAYCAQAAVWHSHSFTLRQEYLRNVQVGRFLQRYGARLDQYGELGEGRRMAGSVMARLLGEGHPLECAAFAMNCGARLLGNRAGRRAERRKGMNAHGNA